MREGAASALVRVAPREFVDCNLEWCLEPAAQELANSCEPLPLRKRSRLLFLHLEDDCGLLQIVVRVGRVSEDFLHGPVYLHALFYTHIASLSSCPPRYCGGMALSPTAMMPS